MWNKDKRKFPILVMGEGLRLDICECGGNLFLIKGSYNIMFEDNYAEYECEKCKNIYHIRLKSQVFKN